MVIREDRAKPPAHPGFQASALHALGGTPPKVNKPLEEAGSESPARSMDLFTPLSGLAGELCRPRTVGGAAGPADGGSDVEGEREAGVKRKGSYNPVKSKRAKEVSEGEMNSDS